MIRVFCDRCGAELCNDDTIKAEGRVESKYSLVVDTPKTHKERDVCETCMKSFDSWWSGAGMVANVYHQPNGSTVQTGGILSGGIVLTKEQVRGARI